jgi:transcriptional regulator with XRE-family HTH domain
MFRTVCKRFYERSAFTKARGWFRPRGMNDLIRNRRDAFRQFVADRGSVASIARRSGVPPTTIYSYLDGKSDSLKGTTEEKIAAAFDVPIATLFGGAPTQREVAVAFYVGAGAEVLAMNDGQGPFDYVEAPDYANEATVAARVEGASMGPWFDGWLVFYDDVRSPITPDLHGEICVVGLDGGRVLLKKVQPARSPGLYHLHSQFEEPITDVVIRWAAKVTGMRPR